MPLLLKQIRLWADNTKNKNSSSKRFRALMDLLVVDNGGIGSSRLTHFCTGANCCPKGRYQALYKAVCALLDRFGAGYQAPLLHRWKHAEASQEFMTDGIEIHMIVPKTLQHIGDMGQVQQEYHAVYTEFLAEAAAAGHGSNEGISVLEQAGVKAKHTQLFPTSWHSRRRCSIVMSHGS
jgi:hypothetical protein